MARLSNITHGLRTTLRLLARDIQGSSLVETALIAPLLVTLAAGSVDAGLGYARKLKVQQAAARATELATVSGLVSSLQTTMQSEAATAAGVSTSNVTIDMWLECDGVRQSDVNGTCAASAPARFVSVTISDTYTPLYAGFFSGGGVASTNTLSVPLSGYASVRVQ